MTVCRVRFSRKGQMKIQQMAFVLIAVMIFFGIVALIYFSVQINSVKSSAVNVREENAKELAKKIAGSPEFIFSQGDCSNCVDFDKVLMLKEMKGYEGFWKLDYLAVRKIYPKGEERECTRANYPECSSVTIVNGTKNLGAVHSSFVSLCRWEPYKEGYYKCEIGAIDASGVGING